METKQDRAVQKERAREALRIAEAEGRFLSEYRKQGRDVYFQFYLANQHVRILGARIARAIAVPILNGMHRGLR